MKDVLKSSGQVRVSSNECIDQNVNATHANVFLSFADMKDIPNSFSKISGVDLMHCTREEKSKGVNKY